MKKNEISLYVHVPFCKGKCYYCNFTSFCNKENLIEEYFECLKTELINRLDKHKLIKSIFIGGGTPSAVDSKYIVDLMLFIFKHYIVSDSCEITIEANPNSVTREKLEDYYNAKINRISLGVQSINDNLLKTIGRIHNSKQVFDALQNIKNVGFKNVNADLLLGLPNQTKKDLILAIDKLKEYVTHFSVYSLILEEDTALKRMVDEKQIMLPSEELSVEMYNYVNEYLKKFDFCRYEVSNYALKGYECKHNRCYWEYEEYLGIGVASCSFYNGYRYTNVNNIEAYILKIKNNKQPYTQEHITLDMGKMEYVMTSLREVKGIDLLKYELLFHKNLQEEKKNEIRELQNLKLIEVSNNYLYALDKGFLVLNQIILKLI